MPSLFAAAFSLPLVLDPPPSSFCCHVRPSSSNIPSACGCCERVDDGRGADLERSSGSVSTSECFVSFDLLAPLALLDSVVGRSPCLRLLARGLLASLVRCFLVGVSMIPASCARGLVRVMRPGTDGALSLLDASSILTSFFLVEGELASAVEEPPKAFPLVPVRFVLLLVRAGLC